MIFEGNFNMNKIDGFGICIKPGNNQFVRNDSSDSEEEIDD